MKNYLSLCIMSKNENEYLKENIQYHIKLGVDHFYIYDNGSDMPLKEDLADFKNVTVIDWDDSKISSHCRAFDDCLNKFNTMSRWIGFIDTDEFIVLNKKNSLKEFLKEYESYAGLGINWKCFGSSGHLEKQHSVIDSYTYAKDINDNIHIKSIVQCKWVKQTGGNPHCFIYKPGKFCVDEKKNRIPGPHNKNISYSEIQLNHYVTRSRADFLEKRMRGGGNDRSNKKLTEQFWNRFQGGVEDLNIHKLLQRLNENSTRNYNI